MGEGEDGGLEKSPLPPPPQSSPVEGEEDWETSYSFTRERPIKKNKYREMIAVMRLCSKKAATKRLKSAAIDARIKGWTA